MLPREEALDIRSLHPIKGKLQGRLVYGFNVTSQAITDLATKAVVSMKDGSGRPFATPVFVATKSYLGPDEDFPGLRPGYHRELKAQILQTLVSNFVNDAATTVGSVEIEIKNEGTVTTGIRPASWSAAVMTNGVMYQGRIITVKAPIAMTMNSRTYTIVPQDANTRKIGIGIKSGAVAHGWLEALFSNNEKPSYLVSPGSQLNVYFEDDAGIPYTVTVLHKAGDIQLNPKYYSGGGVRLSRSSR